MTDIPETIPINPSKKPTHVAFADESHHNVGRYRSIALVTLPMGQLGSCNIAAAGILCDCKLSEFKFSNIYGASDRNAIIRLLECIVEKAHQGNLRIDILVWDIQDSRHKIIGRDDTENLNRMYYHLLRTTMKYRWPNDAIWRIYPDHNSGIRWNDLTGILQHVGLQPEKRPDLFTPIVWGLDFIREFDVERIVPCHSHDTPLIQVSDIFAGLAVFSRVNYNTYKTWESSQGSQTSLLFNEDECEMSFSRAEKERCRIIRDFNRMCKDRKMYVSLDTHSGLKTMNPSFPINFWWYEPQHPDDKAPVKQRQIDW